MGIFDTIKDAIFGEAAAASPASAESEDAKSAKSGSKSASQATASGSGAASQSPHVDLAAMLDGLAKKSSDDIDWRRSIVDLMKMLELDSSLKARRELAKELEYDGDLGDSAKMNVWLHEQVMTKLAEHGGVVPDELR
ncbi:MAG: DUF3597 domain-containing protein [Hyphomicrobiaceae bacterium]